MIARVLGLQVAEGADGRRGVRGEAGGAEHALGRQRGPTTSSVVTSAGRGADLGEQVAAQQRPGRLLEQHLGLPPVGHVRRRDLPQPLPADVEHLPVGEDAGGRSHRSLSETSQPSAAEGDLA